MNTTSRTFFAVAITGSAITIQFLLPHGKQAYRAVRFDTSTRPLTALNVVRTPVEHAGCVDEDCGISPESEEEEKDQAVLQPAADVGDRVTRSDVEQLSQGARPPAALVASFDGLGFGFSGPQGTASARNPSDNSLAAGPNHIVQIVNSRMAVFTKKGAKYSKTGDVLYGPVVTNAIFQGFGGQCENRVSGDAVVRYDQLADRWLYVLPIFRRPPDDPKAPYSMCYAVTVGPDPLGPYHRYEFKRPLFPDYPRPAVWPDGYYLPTSTGDTVIQKHACVADRTKMLAGEAATEQCLIVDGVNFLNNADLDGQTPPPPGARNIIMAAGGTQLKNQLSDDGIYVYQMHVDWQNPANTKLSEPQKIKVAPYAYLCGGQLTKCVSQPGTEVRLDAQGDKLMQRLVYRNLGDHEAVVALHSVNTAAGGGGVRWYEFRLDRQRKVYLHQQGTYAPDGHYRWMGSIGIDGRGGIGIGYSFGGAPNFAGQRFAGRLAADALGQLTFHETVLAEGQASQTNTLRWEDYATTAMDPSDNCTFWYVGDYLKEKAPTYSTKIGGFRLPGCLTATVSGTVFFDANHDGRLSPGEMGLSGFRISHAGATHSSTSSDGNGKFSLSLDADSAYGKTSDSLALDIGKSKWLRTPAVAILSNDAVKATDSGYELHLDGGEELTGLDLGTVCEITNRNFKTAAYWAGGSGMAILHAHETQWLTLLNEKLYLVKADGSRFQPAGDRKYQQLRNWLKRANSSNGTLKLSAELTATALNVAFREQQGNATISDPTVGDWPTLTVLIERVNAAISQHSDVSRAKYLALLKEINHNHAKITPPNPGQCGARRNLRG